MGPQQVLHRLGECPEWPSLASGLVVGAQTLLAPLLRVPRPPGGATESASSLRGLPSHLRLSFPRASSPEPPFLRSFLWAVHCWPGERSQSSEPGSSAALLKGGTCLPGAHGSLSSRCGCSALCPPTRQGVGLQLPSPTQLCSVAAPRGGVAGGRGVWQGSTLTGSMRPEVQA